MKTKYLLKIEGKVKIAKIVLMGTLKSVALYPSFQDAPDETQGPEMEPNDSSKPGWEHNV